MSKHRRKRSRRHVRCVLCTDNRDGNSDATRRRADLVNRQDAEYQIAEGAEGFSTWMLGRPWWPNP